MGRRSTAAPLAAALIAGTVLLAGCSSGQADRPGTAGSALLAEGDGGAAAAPAAAPSTAQSTAQSAAQSAVAQSNAPGPLGGATKIRTAELALTVADRAEVARRADQAAVLAVRLGGEVQTEDRGENYASLRLRVPPAQLTAALRTMRRYGQVTALEVSTRDVTSQVADVASRVRSAQGAIARLRTLYASADRVADVIAVEQQLSSREADLESLQARQRALAAQTSLATVSLDLRARHTTEPTPPDRSGFLGGLSRGWDAFTGALAAVVTALGTASPFLLLGAALLLLGRLAVRARRRRRPVSPQA